MQRIVLQYYNNLNLFFNHAAEFFTRYFRFPGQHKPKPSIHHHQPQCPWVHFVVAPANCTIYFDTWIVDAPCAWQPTKRRFPLSCRYAVLTIAKSPKSSHITRMLYSIVADIFTEFANVCHLTGILRSRVLCVIGSCLQELSKSILSSRTHTHTHAHTSDNKIPYKKRTNDLGVHGAGLFVINETGWSYMVCSKQTYR